MDQGEGLSQTSNESHIEAFTVDDSGQFFPSGPQAQGKLKQRHVQMYDHIAGTLGTGLFLGSGQALSGAGPVGALIAYGLVATVAYSSLCSVGEMTSFAPIAGSFPYYASRWVDEALGFAVGWNYFYTVAMSVPVEISGAQLLISYWDKNVHHQAIYIVIMCGAVCAINVLGARWFGEAEFMFGVMKLTMITVLILIGLVIDLGGAPNHVRIGFEYWKNPGPFAGPGLEANRPDLDRFLGLLSAILQAAFSFQGIEIAAIAASNAESPRRNVSKAMRKAFYRILIFYMIGIFIAGMIVPSNDKRLLQPFADSTQATAAASPYVIAIQNAGIRVVPSVINACFITSALSAGTSLLYAASRILHGLAKRKQAPKVFLYEHRDNPIAAVLFTSAFSLFSFMSLSHGADTAFHWLVNLTTAGILFSWATINLTYLFFYRGLREQKIDRNKFHYWNTFQPWLSIWGLVWCIIFILISGFQVFWHFKSEANDFIANYINIPIFIGLYAYWKISKNTLQWRTEEMDYETDIPSIEKTEKPYKRPNGFWEKIADVLF
ncbi:hypothetical protein HYDPIDRAFT_130547 [Hydnomerulius pinastri MD-312]|nr:hypothetical protein HYDPIDRAFT_130547 [Hydnomerulius pinastri MD-312]